MVANQQNSVEATDQLIKLLKRTPNNAVFLESVVAKTRAMV
jgi:transcription termination factor Rho